MAYEPSGGVQDPSGEVSVGTTYRTRNDKDVLVRGVEQLWIGWYWWSLRQRETRDRSRQITAPGCSKKVITVGSSDMLMEEEGISGRGPTFECVCKPDLAAPGRRIMSCAAGAGNTYGMKSGTSMSTPMISGAAALALEKKDPMLTNVDIKMMFATAQTTSVFRKISRDGKNLTVKSSFRCDFQENSQNLLW